MVHFATLAREPPVFCLREESPKGVSTNTIIHGHSIQLALLLIVTILVELMRHIFSEQASASM